METKLTLITLVLLVFVLANPLYSQVRSDYDQTVDFTKIKTFSFEGWAKDSDKILNDLDKKRMTDAFEQELSVRGLEYKEEGADVAITLYIVIDNNKQ